MPEKCALRPVGKEAAACTVGTRAPHPEPGDVSCGGRGREEGAGTGHLKVRTSLWLFLTPGRLLSAASPTRPAPPVSETFSDWKVQTGLVSGFPCGPLGVPRPRICSPPTVVHTLAPLLPSSPQVPLRPRLTFGKGDVRRGRPSCDLAAVGSPESPLVCLSVLQHPRRQEAAGDGGTH